MLGYDEDAAIVDRRERGGWHRTGDVAWQDSEGIIYIVDRVKDMIISGGFNIYPAEVERAISACQGVADCAVIGLPDPRWGEAVTAIVEMKPGCEADPAGIIAHCKAVLGSMKAPKSVHFIRSLPRSAVGKILKRELRQRYASQVEKAE